jgi:hypothetical protein
LIQNSNQPKGDLRNIADFENSIKIALHIDAAAKASATHISTSIIQKNSEQKQLSTTSERSLGVQ